MARPLGRRRLSQGVLGGMGTKQVKRLLLASVVALAFLGVPRDARAQQRQPAPTPVVAPQLGATQTAAPALPTPTPLPFDGVTAEATARQTFFKHGLLVETAAGDPIIEQGADQAFNPASAVKLATALHALRTLGPQHRFPTAVWITGTFDRATGTVTGDMIISGRDPSFHYQHGVALARELNLLGVRTVTGDLVVAPKFTMNFGSSAQRSGERLYDTLDATRRPAAAARAWSDERIALSDQESLLTTPSVAVMGAVYVDSVPAGAQLLLTHRSSTLTDILKVLLCYSNNFMAERLGDTLGGVYGLERFLTTEMEIPAGEVRLSSTSGLGVNRLSPRSMLKVYRALMEELGESGLNGSDILPVAGIDPGTLQKRFALHPSRGSIIGKTGTLIRTDGGASALVGHLRTRGGETLYFVIFNQRGSVGRFRREQDQLLYDLQLSRGGPAQFPYSPHSLAMRLADTESQAAKANSDEFEPEAN
jgi:D-alanyl-D-alanine carboxypeptidase/D-alanyl-D-alanine-endopeptidase (penicillin-binding protein 4)